MVGIYIYIYPKADPNNMGLYSMGIAIRWDIFSNIIQCLKGYLNIHNRQLVRNMQFKGYHLCLRFMCIRLRG